MSFILDAAAFLLVFSAAVTVVGKFFVLSTIARHPTRETQADIDQRVRQREHDLGLCDDPVYVPGSPWFVCGHRKDASTRQPYSSPSHVTGVGPCPCLVCLSDRVARRAEELDHAQKKMFTHTEVIEVSQGGVTKYLYDLK